MRYIERDLPMEGLNAIAEKERNAKKPIYQIHKWWASGLLHKELEGRKNGGPFWARTRDLSLIRTAL